jgi:hypothetical protein
MMGERERRVTPDEIPRCKLTRLVVDRKIGAGRDQLFERDPRL